jgi:hypothetical protein
VTVHVHVSAKDEAAVLPWFLAHYATFADRIFVHDDGSADGTADLAAAHPLVTVLPHDRGRQGLRDDLLAELKSTAWRDRGAGWVIIVDADELLVSVGVPMRRRLAEFRERGIAVPRPVGYDMTGRQLPDPAEIPRGRQLYHAIRRGVLSDNYSKPCVFDATRVRSVRYEVGCHRARFELANGSTLDGERLPRPPGLHLLHFKRVGGPDAYLARCRRDAERMSQENIRQRWSWHVMPALDDPQFILDDYAAFEDFACVVPGLEAHADDRPELVIARYREDVSWARPLAAAGMRVTVYDKSEVPETSAGNFEVISRPNEGRESETWLHHVITRHDSLAPLTYFAQGNPFDHAPDFLLRLGADYDAPTTLTTCGSGESDALQDLVDAFQPRHLRRRLEVRYGRMPDADAADVWGRVFRGEPPRPLYYGYGMMYAVPRKFLRARPARSWRWLYARRMEAWRAGTEWSHRVPGVNGFVVEALFWHLLQGGSQLLCE